MLRSWDLGQLAPHLLVANTLIALALLLLGLIAFGMPAGDRSRWRRLDFWVGLILLLAAAAAPVRHFTRVGTAETRVAFSEPVLVSMAAIAAAAGCYAVYLLWLLLRRSARPKALADEWTFEGSSVRAREATARLQRPSTAMPAPADTEAAFADLAAALREQLSTGAMQPPPLRPSHSEGETLSLPDAQPLKSSPARLHAGSSSAPGTIQLRIKRFRRTAEAAGGNTLFACEARLELTLDDAELLRRHELGQQVIYGQQASSAPADTALRVTVASLVRGHRVDCRNLAEMLAAEQAFSEACKMLREYLDLAAKLDSGEEVLRF